MAFTQDEINLASQAIRVIAGQNGVPEEQLRSILSARFNEDLHSSEENLKEIWKDFEFAGSEPTVWMQLVCVCESKSADGNRLYCFEW